MRASVDPLRDRAIDLIEAARQQADEVMQAGESRVRDLVDARAEQASSGVDRLAQNVPSLTVEANRRRRLRNPLLVVVLLVVAGALVWSWRRKRHAAPSQELSGPSVDPASRVDDARLRVVPKDDGGWGLVVPGQTEIEHRTQADAIAQARAMAEDAGGGQIVVHGLDGQPRTTVTV